MHLTNLKLVLMLFFGSNLAMYLLGRWRGRKDTVALIGRQLGVPERRGGGR